MCWGRIPPRDSRNQRELRRQALALPAGLVKSYPDVETATANKKLPQLLLNINTMTSKSLTKSRALQERVAWTALSASREWLTLCSGNTESRRSFRRKEPLWTKHCTAWGDFPTPLQIWSCRKTVEKQNSETKQLGMKKQSINSALLTLNTEFLAKAQLNSASRCNNVVCLTSPKMDKAHSIHRTAVKIQTP